MTVGELRDLLANYHDASIVLVDGYEEGYTTPCVKTTVASKGHSSGWWSGDWDDDETSGVPVVVIGR